MTGRPDPWRSRLIAVLAIELVVGVAYGGMLWSIWHLDFGNEAASREPSWSAGPWWLAAGIVVCAALWTAAIVLNARRAPGARIALAVIAGLHVVVGAAAATATDLPDMGRIVAVVGLLACGALIATVAIFPGRDSASGRRRLGTGPRRA